MANTSVLGKENQTYVYLKLFSDLKIDICEEWGKWQRIQVKE